MKTERRLRERGGEESSKETETRDIKVLGGLKGVKPSARNCRFNCNIAIPGNVEEDAGGQVSRGAIRALVARRRIFLVRYVRIAIECNTCPCSCV